MIFVKIASYAEVKKQSHLVVKSRVSNAKSTRQISSSSNSSTNSVIHA